VSSLILVENQIKKSRSRVFGWQGLKRAENAFIPVEQI
jgi:hypothetical protein